jgi:hypothetical protein
MTAMGYLIVVLTFGAVALIVAWVTRADRPPRNEDQRAPAPPGPGRRDRGGF